MPDNQNGHTSFEAQIAAYANEFDVDAVPDDVIEKAKLVLLDTIGVGIAGSSTDYITAYHETIRRSGMGTPNGTSTTFTNRGLASSTTAALLNSSAANATEFYEGTQGAGMPGIHVVPSAVAVAEETQASGSELLESVILGYELSVRVGRAIRPMLGDLHPHGAWAPIGSAIAVGHLLGFTEEQFTEAIQIAVNPFVAGSFLAATEGATVRDFYSGKACAHGIRAARLAESGVTGVENAILRCLFPYTSGEDKVYDDLESVFSDVGEYYYLSDNRFKFHASASYSHSPADAVEKLQTSHGLEVDTIEAITVRTMDMGTVSEETSPENPLSAKFSTPYVVASQIVTEETGLDAFSEERVNDPEIQAVADKVDVVATETYERLAEDDHWAAEVEITFEGGDVISEEVIDSKGYGKNAATASEVAQKFHDVLANTISDSTVSDLENRIMRLEDENDCSELLASYRAEGDL